MDSGGIRNNFGCGNVRNNIGANNNNIGNIRVSNINNSNGRDINNGNQRFNESKKSDIGIGGPANNAYRGSRRIDAVDMSTGRGSGSVMAQNEPTVHGGS